MLFYAILVFTQNVGRGIGVGVKCDIGTSVVVSDLLCVKSKSKNSLILKFVPHKK